ncbi:PIN domain protein [Bacteroidales bacterium Barb7]|nr:PIN domain protein [Bacteroidales bacterium Barb7]
MRYDLDTNILIFMLSNSGSDDISCEVADKMSDYSSIFYASSIAVNELILLYKSDKIKLKDCKSAEDIIPKMKQYGIEIVYYNQYHLEKDIALDLIDSHKDMNDHAIIAQAIADKIPLVSSDTKFHCYTGQGLDFVFNRK